eukprot:762720-Hanusia_phi.AAC.2
MAFPIGYNIYLIRRLSKLKNNSASNSGLDNRQTDACTVLTQGPSTGIRIETLTPRYFRGALNAQNKFTGAGRKRLCCLVPLTLFPTSMLEFELTFATENACSASAVAVRESDDEVVGFVHMTDRSMEREVFLQVLHPLQEGECYIESMCVLSEVRGKGIGTRLLEFCEARARERKARVLSLGVVANNPARHLYERFGFVDLQRSAGSKCCSAIGLFCFLGCPHWGCGAEVMVKTISALEPHAVAPFRRLEGVPGVHALADEGGAVDAVAA